LVDFNIFLFFSQFLEGVVGRLSGATLEHLLGSAQVNFYWLFVETIPDSISNITCHDYLGLLDTNRIVSVCATSPKVIKAGEDTVGVMDSFAKRTAFN
jgi:hypothetical protein